MTKKTKQTKNKYMIINIYICSVSFSQKKNRENIKNMK